MTLLTAEQRASNIVGQINDYGPTSAVKFIAGEISAAEAAAHKAGRVEEREVILNYALFLLKEHCATKGEERGMNLIIECAIRTSVSLRGKTGEKND